MTRIIQLHRAIVGCTGGCHQGDLPCDCHLSETEASCVVPLRPHSVVWIRPAITVHRIPLSRRAKRFLRALWVFMTNPNF